MRLLSGRPGAADSVHFPFAAFSVLHSCPACGFDDEMLHKRLEICLGHVDAYVYNGNTGRY